MLGLSVDRLGGMERYAVESMESKVIDNAVPRLMSFRTKGALSDGAGFGKGPELPNSVVYTATTIRYREDHDYPNLLETSRDLIWKPRRLFIKSSKYV